MMWKCLIGAGALWLAACSHHSPYAGWQQREIKALSESDIAGLRAGRGMSMALPAELNGYPGPLHVLELKERLALTPDQVRRTEALFAAMKSQAMAAGEEVIAAERAVEAVFAKQSASRAAQGEALREALLRAGSAQAKLRAVHLQAHLDQVSILSPSQVAQYNQWRGYAR